MYSERKIKEEGAAIVKKKKKKLKVSFGGIGPFLKENGDQIADSEAEALRKTYEKAFSKPNKEYLVELLWEEIQVVWSLCGKPTYKAI